MRILFISEYWPPFQQGGGEVSTYSIAKALAEKGIEISVLTSYFPNSKKEETLNNLKIYRRIKTGKDVSSFFSNITRSLIMPLSTKIQTKKLLKKENFDIIHYFNTGSALGNTKGKTFVHINSPVFFCPKGTLMYKDKTQCDYKCTPARFLKCFLKSKEFLKMKNKWYLKYNPGMQLFLYLHYKKRLKKLKQFKNYIAVSEFMKEKLKDNNIPENNIKVISNIVNTKELQETNNEIPKILYIGAYVENKGLLLLLNSLKEIKEPYECNLYGYGPLKEELERLSKGFPINIHGKISKEESLDLIYKHDIIVQPSLVAEALPRTLIDAMAAKKTIITTNRGAMKYLIENNKDGLVFNPEENNLTELIKQSFNKETQKRLSENAYKKITVQATKEIVTEKLLQAYKCAA
tara:strand:- start:21 stop:1238 length:1218 start_codon:yes stop_codon:yes gene_type:complete